MMQRTIVSAGVVCVLCFFVGRATAQQQQAPAQQPQAAQQSAAAMAEPEAPRVVLQAETTASVLRLMKFSGLLHDRAGHPRSGAVGLTFAFYKDQQGGSPLWLEVHNAQLDEQGRYTVLLGSTKSDGLPLEVFSSGEARWLGVQLNLPGEEEQPRVLLVSVPYALKAADAETLGGKPPSAFLLADPVGADLRVRPEAGKETVTEGPPREGVVGPIAGEGSLNLVAKFTGANTIGNGSIFDNGFVGIGTTSPTARLHIFEPEPTQNANVRLMGSGQTGSWMDIFAGTAVGFGLFGYGNQPFLFGVGAVERMRITPTGEVGLGTTSPNAKLSVGSGSIADASVPVQISTGTSGTVSYYGANKNGGYGLLLGYENGGSLGTGGVLRMVSADPLLFVVNNTTEAMRITSTGNVGIGVTAPGQKLTVAGTIESTSGGFKFPDSTVQTTAGGGATATDLNCVGCVAVSELAFDPATQTELDSEAAARAAADSTLQTDINGRVSKAGDTMAGTLNLPANGLVVGTNQLVLSGGNVGIGTTTPSSILSLGGETFRTIGMERRTLADSPGELLFIRAGGATLAATNKSGGILILEGGVSTGFADSEIQFRTATGGASGTTDNTPTTKMTIKGFDGRVGIGTTTPAEKLEVAGNVKITGGGNGIIFPDATVQTTAGGGTATDLNCAAPCVSSAEVDFNFAGSVSKGGKANDAELLDGLDSTAFAAVAHNHDAAYVNVSGDTMVGTLNLPANGLVAGTTQLVLSGGNVGIGIAVPAAKLDVNGSLKVNGSLTIPTTTRILSLPCAAFDPSSSTLSHSRCTSSVLHVIGSTAGTTASFNAPVFLPDGAAITLMEAVVKDSDGSQNITVELRRAGDGAAYSPLASAISSGTPGLTTLSDTVSHTVNNSTGAYLAFAVWTVPVVTTDIALYSVRIHYTITTPLP